MEKKNNNVLVWVLVVVAVAVLVAVLYKSPLLAPAYSGQFAVTKVTNTDPTKTCSRVCSQYKPKTFCIGSGLERVVNLYTYTVNSPGGSCGGLPIQFVSDSNTLFAAQVNLGAVDECAVTGSSTSMPGACNIIQTAPQTGAGYGVAYQETASGPTYCECATLI